MKLLTAVCTLFLLFVVSVYEERLSKIEDILYKTVPEIDCHHIEECDSTYYGSIYD